MLRKTSEGKPAADPTLLQLNVDTERKGDVPGNNANSTSSATNSSTEELPTGDVPQNALAVCITDKEARPSREGQIVPEGLQQLTGHVPAATGWLPSMIGAQ